jgi:hypothetical protein
MFFTKKTLYSKIERKGPSIKCSEKKKEMLSENPSMYKNGIHDSCKKKHVHMKRGPIKTERSTLSTSWQAGGQVPGNCQ